MLKQKLFNEAKRLRLAFGYSMAGFKFALGEAAFRLEIVIAAITIPLAFFITANNVERAILIGSILLLLIVELLNTAVETAINRISTEIHPLSKKAKDIGSAAVFIAAVNAALIWLVIVWN